MKVDNSAQIRNRIEELKRGKHAVILAHYYTLPEVQEVADFLGDSLSLVLELFPEIDREKLEKELDKYV